MTEEKVLSISHTICGGPEGEALTQPVKQQVVRDPQQLTTIVNCLRINESTGACGKDGGSPCIYSGENVIFSNTFPEDKIVILPELEIPTAAGAISFNESTREAKLGDNDSVRLPNISARILTTLMRARLGENPERYVPWEELWEIVTEIPVNFYNEKAGKNSFKGHMRQLKKSLNIQTPTKQPVIEAKYRRGYRLTLPEQQAA